MSAKDIQNIVSVPWLPGSKLKIRPMSLADERKLLTNMDEVYSYTELIKDCVEPLEGFIWDRDFSWKERDYLLSQIRMMTYGDEMILSGYECPHCKFVNSNHLVHLSEYKFLPQLEKVIYKFERSNLELEESRIAFVPYARIEKIREIIKSLGLTGDEALHKELELSNLAIFLDLSIEDAIKLADKGDLSLYDIRKAIHLLNTEMTYGYDTASTMVCHHKDCEKEFAIELAVICPGMLVPYFPDSRRSSSKD